MNQQLEPYRQQHGPVEQGQRIATFPRNRGDEELRVTLANYRGFDYVGLRVWAKGQDGEFYPVRGKGCSVRLAEAGELAEALSSIARQHEASRLAGPDRGRGTDRGPVGEGNYLGRRRDAPQSRGTSRWGPPRQHSLPAPQGRASADPPFEPTTGGQGHAPFDEFP